MNTTRDPESRSYAGQARGIALRELGDARAAIRQLESALTDAGRVGAARQADVEASLGATLAVAGRTAEALARLDSALAKVSGYDAARIRVRQGSLLGEAGRFEEAARVLRMAGRALRRAGDATWESRAELNLAMVCIEQGDTRRAEAALSRAEELLVDGKQVFEAATARQYRGLVAVLDGRIPDALMHYDVAGQRFGAAGTQLWELADSRSAALLSAGLAKDALSSAEHAVALLERPGAAAGYLARALTRAGDAAAAAGKPDLARDYDQRALRLFRDQGRDVRAIAARLGTVRARRDLGERSGRLLREATDVATAASRHRMACATEAHLFAGEVALGLGNRDAAITHLERAQRARSNRSYTAKVLGWHACALRAQARGRHSAVLRACERGLAVLEAHQLTLGAIETRAAATTHGQPLAALALRQAVDSGDPISMFRWAERWRATTFTLPPVRSADDAELAAELAQLRLARQRLDYAVRDGRPSRSHEHEVLRLESDVRARALRASATAPRTAERTDVLDLLGQLDSTRIVEIAAVGDTLHVLVASADRVSHYVAGSREAALRTTDFARFALRRMTHRSAAARARASLPSIASTLEQQLLGAAVDDLGSGNIVIVPPAALSAAPWGILPALRQRQVSVAPSAASWLTALRADPGAGRDVVLVAGPDLRHSRAEVEMTAQLYPEATVLGTAAVPATAGHVLEALDGAWLAHVAAHGQFRDDNPMFSALVFDDGPLTVFDLQRLKRAPYRLVLSCCDTGTASAAGADEMLGLLTALTPLGTAGMLAAVVPVSDEAAIGFASIVHEQLRGGASTAQALLAARLAAEDDQAAFAIAHAFVAFGAV